MNREEITQRLDEIGIARFDNTLEQNKAIQRETFYLTELLKLEDKNKELEQQYKDDERIIVGLMDKAEKLEQQVKNYANIVIELINNEPNSHIGFDIEEIYNQALTDKE